MVGYLMLMKLRHSRQNRRRRFIKIKSPESQQKLHRTETNVEPHICRVCLKDGYIPIFGDSVTPNISEDIRIFTDINISQNDSYPKYICQSCNSLLQGAQLFRKTAQISDENLQQPAEVYHSDNDDNIQNDKEHESMSRTEEKDVPETFNIHCNRCTLSFQTLQEYNKHRLSLEHKNRVCPICNKSYEIKSFKKHLELHKPKTSYMCDICKKKFVHKQSLMKHRLSHFNYCQFKCTLCPYQTNYQSHLKIHIQRHTGEKPHQCPECPSKFASKSNLSSHMLTHKEHDFICEPCGRGFYTKKTLELHVKVNHNGIKDHVCDICGKAFGYRHHLMYHIVKVHKTQKYKTGKLPLHSQIKLPKEPESN